MVDNPKAYCNDYIGTNSYFIKTKAYRFMENKNRRFSFNLILKNQTTIEHHKP